MYLFIYLWLCWVFTAVQASLQWHLARVTLCYGVWASYCGGLSHCKAQAPGHAGFSSCGSQAPSTGVLVVMHELCYSVARKAFPDQGWALCLLH